MSIERDVYVLKDAIKTPIDYVRGTNAIPIVFHFRDYDIPSGSIAAVYVKKPSGNAVYNNASVSGNDVTVDVTTQMFAEFGQNILQIQISKNNDNLVTFSQPVNVHENNTDEDATKSENESTILQDVKAATAAANEAAESANAAAEEAESKAQAADQAAQDANEASQQIQQNAAAGNYSASVSVGTVTTGDPGTQAQIYNSGTKKDAIFNFIIPQGPQGETGPQGPEGPPGPAGSLDDIEDATVTFSQASSRTNINSGDSIGMLFGKIRKWFADLGTAAFQGVSNALTQTTSGYVLDARQGKTLADRIGTLSSLLTTAKTSLVNAVNELFNNIGDLNDLSTAEKGNIVGAVNEINTSLADVLSPEFGEIYNSANGTVTAAKIGRLAIVRFTALASSSVERSINYNADYAPAIDGTSVCLTRNGVLLASSVLNRDSSTGRANLAYKAPSGQDGTYTGWVSYITYS